jgi:hypothetical protein
MSPSRRDKETFVENAFTALALSLTSPATSVQQMSQLELQQAALEGLALPHDLEVQAASFYQPGFGKPQVDRTRDGFRNR